MATATTTRDPHQPPAPLPASHTPCADSIGEIYRAFNPTPSHRFTERVLEALRDLIPDVASDMVAALEVPRRNDIGPGATKVAEAMRQVARDLGMGQ